MGNREIDELLFYLREKLDKKYGNVELSFILTYDFSFNSIKQELFPNIHIFLHQLIDKIISDFYAYYLYKEEIGDSFEDIEKEIVSDLDFLPKNEVLNYLKFNISKFSIIINKYFEYHENSILYQCMVMANVVNKRKVLEIASIYSDFFETDLNYQNFILSNYAILGLDLRDCYYKSMDDKKIIQFLKIEFDNQQDRNNFLNYILSNVYANLKLSKNLNNDSYQLVSLIEKLDTRMKCFYDSDEFVIDLVKKYFDIYGDIKWFEFKDIRDYIPFNSIDLIYKLDNSYKHPQDTLKIASKIYNILDEVQLFVNNILQNLTIQGKTDEEIIDWFYRLFNNQIVIKFEDNSIFSYENDDYFKNLIKLFFLSSYYEFCNYNDDDLLSYERELLVLLDSGMDIEDNISLFDDEGDCKTIINRVIEYYFSKETIEFLARKKIVNDNKVNSLLKINPYIFLEYRRLFGVLFPFETSKSTEYGNMILHSLFDIISLSENLEDEQGIKYEDLAQIFKNDYFEINLDIDEIVGFILSNIYENLYNKKQKTDEENYFISCVESNNLNLDAIINNDNILGELLLYFFNLNGEYFNDDKLRKLRRSVSRDKIKILEKLNPFYDIDGEILK